MLHFSKPEVNRTWSNAYILCNILIYYINQMLLNTNSIQIIYSCNLFYDQTKLKLSGRFIGFDWFMISCCNFSFVSH